MKGVEKCRSENSSPQWPTRWRRTPRWCPAPTRSSIWAWAGSAAGGTFIRSTRGSGTSPAPRTTGGGPGPPLGTRRRGAAPASRADARRPPRGQAQEQGGNTSPCSWAFFYGPEGNRIPVSAMRMRCITTILQAPEKSGMEVS